MVYFSQRGIHLVSIDLQKGWMQAPPYDLLGHTIHGKSCIHKSPTVLFTPYLIFLSTSLQLHCVDDLLTIVALMPRQEKFFGWKQKKIRDVHKMQRNWRDEEIVRIFFPIIHLSGSNFTRKFFNFKKRRIEISSARMKWFAEYCLKKLRH